MQIDAHDRVPAVETDFFHRRTETGPMIVDQDIDLAEFLQRTLHHAVHLLWITHVNGEREGAFPQAANSLRGRLQVLHTPAAQHNIGSCTGAFERNALADADTPTSDNNRFTLE